MTQTDQEFHNKMMVAIGYHQKGDFKNAEKEYFELLDIYPDNATLHANLGTLYYQIREYDAALEYINDAIRLDELHPAAHNTKGITLLALEKYDDALTSLLNAIRVNPNYKEAYYNIGNTFNKLDRLEDAVDNYKIAIDIDPAYMDAYFNLGNVLRDMNRLDESIDTYQKAIQINDKYFQLYYNLAQVLRMVKRFDEAKVCYDKVLEINPTTVNAYINGGNVLHELGNYEKSLEYSNKAIELAPDNSLGYYNKGVTYQRLLDFNTALECYETANNINPTDPMPSWNTGIIKLTQGDLVEGFKHFENRLNLFSNINNIPETYNKWNGIESLNNKIIFVYFEQGIGDFLHFCRYINVLEDMGAKVILETPPSLTNIATSLSANVIVIETGSDLPYFDYYCPIMSLAFLTNTTLDTIPAKVPYLFADKTKVKAWAKKLGRKTVPRIGLVWTDTNSLNTNERMNIPLELLAPFAGVKADFISLQLDDASDQELKDLINSKWGGPIIKNYVSNINDLSDTAALIENLDLVIAVDSTVVHLAGALGKEVWIMNRFDTCWRWLLDRSDSPWYPTAMIFRQSSLNDWISVVTKITNALYVKFSKKKAKKLSAKKIETMMLTAERHLENDELKNASLIYEEIIDSTPNDAIVLTNLGTIYYRLGKIEQAINLMRRAIKIDDTHSITFNNLGNACTDFGLPDEAIGYYKKAVELDRNSADANYNYGNMLYNIADYTTAVEYYTNSINIHANNVAAYYNRGMAHHNLKMYEAAISDYEKAIELNATYSKFFYSLGNSLAALHKYPEAVEQFNKAIELEPTYSDAYLNRGNALQYHNKITEAADSYYQITQFDPEYRDSYCNYGNMLFYLNKLEESVNAQDKILEKFPTHVSALWNKSHPLLAMGKYEEGFKLFEYRNDTMCKYNNKAHKMPKWDGRASLDGKVIFVYLEQGIGDFIQFSRYFTMLEELGATVISEVQVSLASLAKNITKNLVVAVDGDVLPPFDYYTTVMSLPYLFNTTVDTIPADIPYLFADKTKTKEWAKKLGKKTKPRVGLVWSGGFRQDQPETWSVNSRRNIALKLLEPLTEVDVEFISVQVGKDAEQELTDLIEDNWNGPKIRNYVDDIKDFSDTAALIENLDLVIAVDTSTVHLAGALGKEVWIMNRFDTCWRWFLDRTDSPWYPTARLFRQPALGDWKPVVSEIVEALKIKFL